MTVLQSTRVPIFTNNIMYIDDKIGDYSQVQRGV